MAMSLIPITDMKELLTRGDWSQNGQPPFPPDFQNLRDVIGPKAARVGDTWRAWSRALTHSPMAIQPSKLPTAQVVLQASHQPAKCCQVEPKSCQVFPPRADGYRPRACGHKAASTLCGSEGPPFVQMEVRFQKESLDHRVSNRRTCSQVSSENPARTHQDSFQVFGILYPRR